VLFELRGSSRRAADFLKGESARYQGYQRIFPFPQFVAAEIAAYENPQEDGRFLPRVDKFQADYFLGGCGPAEPAFSPSSEHHFAVSSVVCAIGNRESPYSVWTCGATPEDTRGMSADPGICVQNYEKRVSW